MSFRKCCRLLYLIKKKDNERAKAYIKNGSLYDAVDKSNNTLLHYAAKFGNHEIAKYLIDAGSKVDPRNNFKQTPLLIKSIEQNLPCTKVVQVLLEAGAEIYETDILGHDTMRIADDSEWLSKNSKRYETLKVILELGNVDNFTELNVLFFGTKEEIEPLLRTNISLSTSDFWGNTLTHVLASNRRPGVVELLRGRNYNVNVRDGAGRTPLMEAAFFGIYDAVEFLLDEGADVEATDKYNESALHVAIEPYYDDIDEDRKRVVQVLLERGSNFQIKNAGHGRNSIIGLLLAFFERCFVLAEIVLAHATLQEALGTIITDFTRGEINSNDTFKAHFEQCQKLLWVEICPSLRVFDALTASEKKLERYLRNDELASKLMGFQTKMYYFDTILQRRLEKVKRMIALRETAGRIVGKLMKLGYNSYPFIAGQVADYLEERDIRQLILVQDDIE